MSHHITINGTPLCQCEGHADGILNGEVKYLIGSHPYSITCGYDWAVAAAEAAHVVARHRPNDRVAYVEGACPRWGDICAEETA